MQALSEKMMRFQQKHSAFAVAMNNSSCSIPIARSMQKKALSSPELGAFLHIWGKMFGVHLLFTKKLLTLYIQRIILKAKERDLYVSDNGKHPYGQ